MSLTLITPPAVEPITLAQAKAHCRIDGTADDDLLAIYIKAARYACEGQIHSALITQDWAQKLDEFPDISDIKLLKPPVQSILSVTYVDADSVTQTLDSSLYVLDSAVSPGWLFPADGTVWPWADDVNNSIVVTMRCGFGDAGTDVPSDIISWMLLFIAQLYNQREAVDSSGKSSAVPNRFFDGLLGPWRQYGL